MHRHHTTDTIPGVGYLRCSSDAQELSIDQQREAVEPYAKSKGIEIIRWYIDEGKSASKDVEKRIEFHRMIADSYAKDFRVIVTYDLSRFTRLDNIDGNEFKKKLRDNGVYLETTKEGPFDWRTAEGRWKDQAYCEAANAASLNLSKDSLRGRLNVLRLGYWPCGSVPYGFDRLYTDGKHEIRVGRSDRTFRKGRNWHLKLVVNDTEAAIIREIFERYVKTGISLRALALDLSRRGIPSPEAPGGKTQGAWDKDTVKNILKQRAYLGIASLGNGRRTRTAHNRAESTEVEGACPVIVDRATWEEAQDLMERKRVEKRRPHYQRSGVLSGFLVCGHCGHRLRKVVYKKTGRIYYVCDTATKHPTKGCKQWRVYEDTLIPDIVSWLVKEIDDEFLKAIKASAKAESPDQGELLRSRVKDLQTRFERATTNALSAPSNAVEAIWAQVAKIKQELDEAQERLSLHSAVKADPQFADFGGWWSKVRTNLIEIPTEFASSGMPVATLTYASSNSKTGAKSKPYIARAAVDKDYLRGLLTKLGFSLKLTWRHEPEARMVDRTAPEWVIDRQEISIRYRLRTCENSPADDSISNSHIELRFTRSRKVT